jgi:hypothetical protein
MVSHPRKTAFVNVLGTLGYISIIFQWLWSFVVVANPLLSSDLHFLIPTNPAPAHITPNTSPSPLMVGVVVVLTVLIFAMTLYVIWKLPRAIGSHAARTTKRAADALVPLVTHHHAPSKKERHRLSRQLVLVLKLVIVLLPFIALLWANPIGELTRDIILVVGLFCACCSLLYFGLQWLCARLWNIPPEHMW